MWLHSDSICCSATLDTEISGWNYCFGGWKMNKQNWIKWKKKTQSGVVKLNLSVIKLLYISNMTTVLVRLVKDYLRPNHNREDIRYQPHSQSCHITQTYHNNVCLNREMCYGEENLFDLCLAHFIWKHCQFIGFIQSLCFPTRCNSLHRPKHCVCACVCVCVYLCVCVSVCVCAT